MICLLYAATEGIIYCTKMFSHFSLELNTYKNVVKEEDIFCFNMQIH